MADKPMKGCSVLLIIALCAQSCLTLCKQTVGHQAPLSVEFSRQENEWVAISFSRESSQSRDRTCVSCISCIGRWIL